MNENKAELVDVAGNRRSRRGDTRMLDSGQPGANRKPAPLAERLGSPDLSAKLRSGAKTAPLKPGKKRGTKTVSTKAEADWLKRCFPVVIEGEPGRWDVRPDCAGFGVYFRVDKRQNNGEPINLKFPRISREMFLTLKGMNQNECKETIENYVRGHLKRAVERGDGKARSVAERLSFAS